MYYFSNIYKIANSTCGTLHEPKLTNWKCVYYSFLLDTPSWNQRNHPNHQTLKNADRGGEEDEKIFLSAKEKEGDLVQKEAYRMLR